MGDEFRVIRDIPLNAAVWFSRVTDYSQVGILGCQVLIRQLRTIASK